MKNIQNKLFVLLFIALTFPLLIVAQDSSSKELSFEITRNHRVSAISKKKFNNAQTFGDVYSFYRPSWVREYLSVETSIIQNGSIKKFISTNDTLTSAQKELINTADFGSDIEVRIQYIAENNLKENTPREMDFKFSIATESDAKYVSGSRQINKYLKENAIDKIPASSLDEQVLAVVKFTINEKGEVINPHIFQSSRDENIDEILLATISDMPNWKPAEYPNGKKIKQDFVFNVGNMDSCIINLLNTDRSISNANRK